MSAVFGKVASIVTPPVKSIARLSPRVASETMETIMSTIDSPYHTRRVAMNGKWVGLWKNSMCLSDPADVGTVAQAQGRARRRRPLRGSRQG